MTSPVAMCSQALALIGARPIASLDGAGAEAVVCNQLYPLVVEDMLSRYRWRFASRQVTLERLSSVPLSRFASAYQLPAGVSKCEVYAVLVNDAPITFDRFEQHIYCDAGEADAVIAEVKVVPNEAYWPAYFRALIVQQMAAVIAIPIAEDAEKASLYEGKALRQFASAKTLDAQTRTARKVPVGGLRRYHGGRP